MTGWRSALLIAAALLLGALKIYSEGKNAGRAAAEAQYAKQLRKAEADIQRKSDAIDQLAAAQLVTDQQRDTIHREIIRESSQIIDRPIYRDTCVDADGLRLLDRATANANGEDPAPSANPAAAAATRPAGR
ncbi:MAG TPA: hypothetical protein VFG34_01220 [Sphingopyxis sp.]|nr:hypothetical protein [Sphingopyxis sp.]